MWYWHDGVFENYYMDRNTTQYKKIFMDSATPSDFSGL